MPISNLAQERINRQRERNINVILPIYQSPSSTICQNNDVVIDLEPEIIEREQVVGNLFNNLTTSSEHVEKCKCDKSIQVQSGDFIVPFINVLDLIVN